MSNIKTWVPKRTKPSMGPWTAYIGNGVIEILNMHAKVIVKWQGFDDCSRSQDEHEANAKLIASAPDMQAEITTLRTTAQQAMEALHGFIEKELTVGQRYTNEGQAMLDAITALTAALESKT